MVRLNLTPGFAPFGAGLPVKVFTFPSGMEPHIKIGKLDDTLHEIGQMEFLITVRITTASDIVLLLLANDALRRMGAKRINVFIPFLPFARQDRVMVPGEPFSLKVLTNMLNGCNFESIHLYDAHSDVSTALLDNATSYNNGSFIDSVIGEKTKYVIVTPDAGAQKKIYKVLDDVRNKPEDVICASKSRNLATGELGPITLPKYDFSGKRVLVVDDICDGGATFLPIGEAIVNAGGTPKLAVTHGIFSKGVDALNEFYETIHCTDSIRNHTEGVHTHNIHNLGGRWPISI